MGRGLGEPPACSAAMAAAPPPACSAMEAPPPLAPARSSPFPSHPSSAMPDLAGGEDTDEGTKKVTSDNGQVAEHLDGGEIHKEKSCPRKREQKQEYHVQVGEKEIRGKKPNQEIVRNEPARSQNIKREEQDGLREIKSVVNNIRESVKYVRSSQSRVEKFIGVLMQVGLTSASKAPVVDITTRWNSTYLMPETSIPLRSAFNSLEKQDKDYEFAPLSDEWTLAEAVCKLLRVFYTATVTLSGSKYPTSHLYFCELWKIKKMLNTEESSLNMKIMKKEASGPDMIIARMVHQMQLKFNQYWKESYMSACIPVILDPRFKYDLLEYLLRYFGSENEANTWMNDVKKTMKKLFDEYSQEVSVHSQERDIPSAEEVDDEDDPLAAWDQYMRSKRSQMSNELDRYLKEALVPRKKKVDILQWWKINSSNYPVLSTMARDILAIQASTVPSESAFSTGGRVVRDYRSRLSPSTVEMMICLQDWFKAADALDHE